MKELPVTSLTTTVVDGKAIKGYETRYTCKGNHPDNSIDVEQEYWRPGLYNY